MADKKFNFPKIVTPRGTFRFPKISEPDKGNAKFPKPDGEFSVQLLLPQDSPEAKAFIEKLTPTYEAALDEAKTSFSKMPIASRKKLKAVQPNDLFTVDYDRETEEPTGNIIFKFKMKASGVYGPKHAKAGQKWTRKPSIVDAAGKIITNPPAIWGGTVGKVSFQAMPYFIPGTAAAGLGLRLVGVQIINLVTAGGQSAEDMGFTAEDGYQHEDAPAETPEAPAEDATAADDAGDF